MRRPLIGVMTPRYVPFVGGAETHVREVTGRLVRWMDVSVAACDPTGQEPPRDTVDAVPVAKFRGYPKHRDWLISPGLLRYALRERSDVVHLQGIGTAVAPTVMACALLRRKPYIVSFHSGGHSSWIRNRLRRVQWLLLGPLVRRAAAIVAVSQSEVARFGRAFRLPASKFTVIRNGVDLPAPTGRSTTAGAPPAVRIACVARLERFKGQDRLIAALPHVLQRVPSAELLLVGAGPFRDELVRMAEDLGVAESVSFVSLRHDQRQEMADLLDSCNVFSLLSAYEAHPVAVMEALAVGLPCLCTTGSGFTELIDAGLVAGIDRDADPSDIAEQLVRASRQPRRSAWSRTWDDAAEELRALYLDVLGAR